MHFVSETLVKILVYIYICCFDFPKTTASRHVCKIHRFSTYGRDHTTHTSTRYSICCWFAQPPTGHTNTEPGEGWRSGMASDGMFGAGCVFGVLLCVCLCVRL